MGIEENFLNSGLFSRRRYENPPLVDYKEPLIEMVDLSALYSSQSTEVDSCLSSQVFTVAASVLPKAIQADFLFA